MAANPATLTLQQRINELANDIAHLQRQMAAIAALSLWVPAGLNSTYSQTQLQTRFSSVADQIYNIVQAAQTT